MKQKNFKRNEYTIYWTYIKTYEKTRLSKIWLHFGNGTKNIKDILNIIENDKDNKVFRLLDFTKNPVDITDPWYYGNFGSTYYDIKYGCETFLEHILNNKK